MKTRIKYDPNAVEKSRSTSNIEFVLGLNQASDEIYDKNVTKDFWLRGYKETDLP